MRNRFKEWYPLTPDEHELVLNSSVISLDASALLSLYRLTMDDRERVIDLLDSLKGRLWISWQAAFEYQRNRESVYSEQLDAYDKLRDSVGHLRKQLVDSVKLHPVLAQDSIRREFDDRLTQLDEYIQERRREDHPTDLTDPTAKDGVRDALDRILEGRVGNAANDSSSRLAEAKRRIEAKIPPGYLDAKKPEPDRYGDYFVWEEILTYAGAQNADEHTPLIFVTNDAKKDWWRQTPDGKNMGPRPELIREAAALGVTPVRFLSLRGFFESFASHLGWANPRLGQFAPVNDDVPQVEALTEQPADEDSQPAE